MGKRQQIAKLKDELEASYAQASTALRGANDTYQHFKQTETKLAIYQAKHEQAVQHIVMLQNAIRLHRQQRADDRCWLDDQKLYAVLEDGDLGDNHVGDKTAMLENCKRFIEQRCESGGPWKTYAELQTAHDTAVRHKEAVEHNCRLALDTLGWPENSNQPSFTINLAAIEAKHTIKDLRQALATKASDDS